jgi:hypothetical protein
VAALRVLEPLRPVVQRWLQQAQVEELRLPGVRLPDLPAEPRRLPDGALRARQPAEQPSLAVAPLRGRRAAWRQ